MKGSNGFYLSFLILIGLVCQPSSSKDIPEVEIVGVSYTTVESAVTILQCRVKSNLPITAVEWTKSAAATTTPTTINTAGSEYTGGTTDSPSLVITKTQLTDAGYYTCTATSSAGTGTSSAARLIVLRNIIPVRLGREKYTVTASETVVLQCIVPTTTPVNQVFWTKNSLGTILKITSTTDPNKYSGSTTATPSLTIRNAVLEDAGDYNCIIVNSRDETGESAPATLTVVASIPVVKLSEDIYSVEHSEDVTLKCTVIAVPMHTSVHWKKNIPGGAKTEIIIDNRKYTGATLQSPDLTIKSADMNDKGYYTCYAENSIGTGNSQSSYLGVTGNKPTVNLVSNNYLVNEGGTITLECIVTAKPAATSVNWQKTINGFTSAINTATSSRLSGSTVGTPSLTITNAASSDKGYYTCSATNAVGSGSSGVTFLDIGKKPVVTIISPNYNTIIGASVTLHCTVTANPDATSIYWKKIAANGVGTMINMNSGQYIGSTVSIPSLTIIDPSLSDSGKYRCFASNSVGTVESEDTNLNVVGRKPDVSIPTQNYNVNYGSSVTLDCIVTSNPVHNNVYWQKIDVNGIGTNIAMNSGKYSGSTVSQPSLIISNAAQSDEGNYRCFATNSVGIGESQNTKLTVTGNKPVVTVSTQNYNVNYGQSVTLECRVTSNPVHNNVYWQKIDVNGIGTKIAMNSGKYSGSTVSRPSLIISNAAQSDEGNYRCFASNIVGVGESQNTRLTVTGSKPVVTVSTQNYNVNFGSSVTLECRVTSNPVHNNVYWQKIDVNGIGTNIAMNLGKYSGSTVSQPSLIISNAAQSDEGNYRCFASNIVGTGESQNTRLTVTGSKPVVTVSTQNYNINFGSSVTLECRVTSNPVHNNVYWQKIDVNGIGTNIAMNSGKYSGSTVSQPSLIISNAAQSDEGNYRCFASNIVGTGESQNTKLTVSGNNPIVVVSQSYDAQVGSTITLSCAVTADPVQTKVYWQRIDANGISTNVDTNNGKHGGSTVGQPSLTISNIALSDEGNYRCLASNSFGTGQSRNTYLRITGNVPIVTIEGNKYRMNLGSSLTLKCTVLATPSHTDVYWKKTVNNVSTKILLNSPKYTGSTVGTPSLTIKNAEDGDAGSYTCYATNSVGTGQSSDILLEVVGSVPSVQVLQKSYSVNHGESVTLVCTVSGKPAHTNVYWQKTVNGQATTLAIGNKYTGSTVSEPSLTITNTEGSDTGFYTCYATNSVGSGHSQWTYLGVVQNLPVVTVLSSTYSANVGENIVLRCQVTANPQPSTVSWRKINNNVQSLISLGNTQKYSGSAVATPSLTIKSVDQTDKGYYICEGTNAVGKGQSSRTYLDVIGDIPTVAVIHQQYNVNYGDSITLGCTVTGTPTAISIYWQRVQRGQTSAVNINMNNNNKYSGSTISTPSLTIKNADQNDDAKYTCFATNSIGTAQSQETDLTVVGEVPTCVIQPLTYSVLSGNSVTLQCTINSNPVATAVQWTKTSNGQTQNISPNSKYSGATVGSPSLVISSTDTTDEGYYTCTATNSIGTGRSQQALLTVLGVIPSVVIPQTRYSVIVGNIVTLMCTVTASPVHTTVKWTKEVNNSPVDIVVDNNKYSGSTTTTPSLTINNAAKSDAGFYKCTATNSIGTGSSQRTYLEVVGYIPAVNIGASSYSVNIQSSVTLKCTVSAQPKQTSVYWKRINGGVTTMIDTSDQTKYDGSTVDSPSLVILNAASSDEGHYICHATNSVGFGQSAQTYLDVVGDIPIVTASQIVYTGNVGGRITLECQVRSTPVQSLVYWQRIKSGIISKITATSNPSKYSGSTVASPSLTIHNFALTDVAKYRCLAVNSVSTGRSDLITLDVLGNIPSVTASVVPQVTYGEPVVVINCMVNADPKETAIVWQKVINSVPTALSVTSNVRYTGSTVTTPSLTIANVDNSDEGHYICQATNVLGTGSSNQVFLDVVGEPPHLTSVTPSKLVVHEGDIISAVCQTTSNPSSTFKWIKGDSSDVLANGHELKIDTSSKTHDGTYKCLVENVYGSNEATLTVEVHYKPDVIISTVSNTFAGVKSSSINIPCSYTTMPSATKVSWEKITDQGHIPLTIDGQKYGGVRLQSPGLTIFNLDETDAARYECIVTNSVGTGKSEIVQLTIESSVDISIDPTYMDIVVGSPVDATCTTKDTSTFSWYFKDHVITTGPRLRIASTVDTDDGMYTCVATNVKGILQATVDVNVKYAPVSTVKEGNFETNIGEPVTLTCSTRANPSATEWTWSKDGSVLQKHHSDFYLVDMDSLQDYGTYSCIAKNTIGDSSTIVFNVKTVSAVNVGAATSDSEFSAAQIAAIVVGILLAIAFSVIILICCFFHGLCRRSEPDTKKSPFNPIYASYPEVTYFEKPSRAPSRAASVITAPLPQEIRYTKEPVYLSDIQPREYKYVNPEINYLPAIEFSYDNNVDKKDKVSLIEYAYGHKKGQTPAMDKDKSGDVYYVADDHATYSVVEKSRPTQIVGDVYTDTLRS